jgi:8-oxo-dGTP pyrophosphatase MutT (NUDIX family)
MATDPLTDVVCSGGFFLARDTKRFLLLLRTHEKTAGTWGIVGGKKEPNDRTQLDTLTREVKEELGFLPKIDKFIPLELFSSHDRHFHYNTFVMIVDNEFIPNLNSEHAGYAWCSYDNWPKPLHRGVKNSLNNRVIKAKLELLIDLI